MKRIVLLIGMVVFAIMSYAQTNLTVESLKSTTNSYFDISGSKNRSYLYFYGNEATDTVTNYDSLWNYNITVVKDWDDDYKINARVHLDSISGAPAVTALLQGKWSWNDSYTNLDTVTWTGSSSDTTFTLTYGTAVSYRFLNILFDATATAQKSQVERIEIGLDD